MDVCELRIEGRNETKATLSFTSVSVALWNGLGWTMCIAQRASRHNYEQLHKDNLRCGARLIKEETRVVLAALWGRQTQTTSTSVASSKAKAKTIFS